MRKIIESNWFSENDMRLKNRVLLIFRYLWEHTGEAHTAALDLDGAVNKQEANRNTTDLNSGSERSGVFNAAGSNTAPPFEKQDSAHRMEVFIKGVLGL